MLTHPHQEETQGAIQETRNDGVAHGEPRYPRRRIRRGAACAHDHGRRDREEPDPHPRDRPLQRERQRRQDVAELPGGPGKLRRQLDLFRWTQPLHRRPLGHAKLRERDRASPWPDPIHLQRNRDPHDLPWREQHLRVLGG